MVAAGPGLACPCGASALRLINQKPAQWPLLQNDLLVGGREFQKSSPPPPSSRSRTWSLSPKKSICAYDDKGQLAKSDLVDLLVQHFDALMFEPTEAVLLLRLGGYSLAENQRCAYANKAGQKRRHMSVRPGQRERQLYMYLLNISTELGRLV